MTAPIYGDDKAKDNPLCKQLMCEFCSLNGVQKKKPAQSSEGGAHRKDLQKANFVITRQLTH